MGSCCARHGDDEAATAAERSRRAKSALRRGGVLSRGAHLPTVQPPLEGDVPATAPPPTLQVVEDLRCTMPKRLLFGDGAARFLLEEAYWKRR
jgi:hypothetical protein